jgi:ribose/xylose/arabinose/galactoside ABC-type transport system permease subunit
MAGLWSVVGAVCLLFYLLNHAFLTGSNLLGLVRATSTLAIMALGQTLVIISGELDLSIGSTYALAPTVMACLWINQRVDVWIALGVALAVGLVIGAVNAFLTVVAKIPSFIVTLGTLTLVEGVAIQVGNSAFFTPAYVSPPLSKGQLTVFNDIGAAHPLGIPAQVLWLIGATVLFATLRHRTLFGFRLLAVGGNAKAAKAARLNVGRYKTVAFVLCGLCAAVAGVIDFSFLGATEATTSGSSLTFPVFAAVIIGGASLGGGSGTVIGTLTGALLLGVLSNGLALNGVAGGYQDVFTGGIIIFAVGLDRWSSSIRPLIHRIRAAPTS